MAANCVEELQPVLQRLRAILSVDVGEEVAEIERRYHERQASYDYAKESSGEPLSATGPQYHQDIGTALTLLRAAMARQAELEREQAQAYGYLKRVFEAVAPQCTPLDDLMGICTQVDNALAGARIERDEAMARQRTPGTVEACMTCGDELFMLRAKCDRGLPAPCPLRAAQGREE